MDTVVWWPIAQYHGALNIKKIIIIIIENLESSYKKYYRLLLIQLANELQYCDSKSACVPKYFMETFWSKNLYTYNSSENLYPNSVWTGHIYDVFIGQWLDFEFGN